MCEKQTLSPILWDPRGFLLPVQRATNSVNKGSEVVGLKSKEFAVLTVFSTSTSLTDKSETKIVAIDSHVGIAITGRKTDAHVIDEYLKVECKKYKYYFGKPYPVNRLVAELGNTMFRNSQRISCQPFEVGILFAGYDEGGSHIYQVMPSGEYFNCKAMVIGGRSQTVRNYLESNLECFLTSTKEDIICDAIRAINWEIPGEKQSHLNIAIVGENQKFELLSGKDVATYEKKCRGCESVEDSIQCYSQIS
ncbi:proteasome subunit alpha type-1-like [Drosophila nasuta]|uniref:proteasome subunit alpha type-1-like n=1 Tax=Drosophila nasuta TaxID=42062 RepID=UPI00295F1A0A|nr:proteasome subunit alpha type-1-like [Drosophila nasuta]